MLFLLSGCTSMPAVQIDCWRTHHDEPLTIDACHGKQFHITWRFR